MSDEEIVAEVKAARADRRAREAAANQPSGGLPGPMRAVLDINVVALQRAALSVGVLAMLCLPIAEFRSGFLLGNLHPTIDQTEIFIARWGFDAACVVSIMVATFACKFARRRTVATIVLVVVAAPLPILGDAYLEHIDAIVSYPPGYFSSSSVGYVCEP